MSDTSHGSEKGPNWALALFTVASFALAWQFRDRERDGGRGAMPRPARLMPQPRGGSRGAGSEARELGSDGTGGQSSAKFGGPSARKEPHSLQVARSNENGRGREARNPAQIPAPGWKDILWRVYEEIGHDRVLAVAAGVVFYGLLALIPAITAFLSLYVLVFEAGTIREHLQAVAAFMPGGMVDIIGQQVDRITESPSKLSFAFVSGLALALWSANAGVKAIFDALNVIYDEEEKRGFFKLTLISLAFTLGAILFLIVAIGAVVAFPLVFAFLGMESWGKVITSLVRWPILFTVIIGALAVLYRYGPSRENPQWKWVSVGSIFAALAWIVASAAFSYYLSNFANYNATYGSLGAAIGVMMWMWISSIVVLVGAELNAEIEHQTAHDSTEGYPQPLGTRGATMADTVGAAKG